MVTRIDPHWLNGTKADMDGVLEALHEDRACWMFLMRASWSHWQATNPGRCGCRHLVGWRSTRSLAGEPPQRRLHSGRSRHRFGHAPPFRSRRRPDHSGRKAHLFKWMFTSRRPKATFGCRRKSLLRRRRMRKPFFRSAQAIAAPYIKGPVSGTRLVARANRRRHATRPATWSYPGTYRL